MRAQHLYGLVTTKVLIKSFHMHSFFSGVSVHNSYVLIWQISFQLSICIWYDLVKVWDQAGIVEAKWAWILSSLSHKYIHKWHGLPVLWWRREYSKRSHYISCLCWGCAVPLLLLALSCSWGLFRVCLGVTPHPMAQEHSLLLGSSSRGHPVIDWCWQWCSDLPGCLPSIFSCAN